MTDRRGFGPVSTTQRRPTGETAMIYATEARALEIAAMLNAERGHPPAFAVLTQDGWTVVRTYSNPAEWGRVSANV